MAPSGTPPADEPSGGDQHSYDADPQPEVEPEGQEPDRDAGDRGGPEALQNARRDDDSPVERYRNSPGMGVLSDEGEPPEPNEPA